MNNDERVKFYFFTQVVLVISYFRTMKIGIIREEKNPPDSRVPLTPSQCAYLIDKYSIDISVQCSSGRCYSDEEYQEMGIRLVDDVQDNDILMGVKEVPIEKLIANKMYFFFSHTIKKQAYNRKLLQAIIKNNISLVDYETLTNENGARLIAFGRFAGIVGAHNAIMTYGWRSKKYDLKRMKDCKDYAEAKAHYQRLALPPIKIVVTGNGRVANGAAEVLDFMNIRKVSPQDFISETFNEAVYTQLAPEDYVAKKDNTPFELNHFFENPAQYKSIFEPFTKQANVLINGIYWDNAAPVFFTKQDMKQSDFKIEVIGDVTCDIAPVSSIPSTLHASTIADPIFGYDVTKETVTEPHGAGTVDMMTIDNLPNEMPRDASEAFGEQFINNVLSELISPTEGGVLERARMTKDGNLCTRFEYLRDYLEGR